MRVLIQLVCLLALAGAAYGGWQFMNTRGGADAGDQEAATASQAVPVIAQAVRLGTVLERTEAVGTTQARESISVVSEVSGRVSSILFEEGQQVEGGTVLVELDHAQLKAALREMVALREDATRQYGRARQLLSTQNVAQSRVDELLGVLEAAKARVAAAEARLRDMRIRAPFDGVVGLREVSLGAYVAPGDPITTLDDLSTIKLEFSVPERYLGALERDLSVIARSVAFPGMEFEGRISRIGTRVDPASRAVRVQSEFDNPEGLLRPGMFMAVELILERREDAIMVPEQAILTEGGRQSVFVLDVEDRAHRRDVEIGQRTGGWVEIVEGLDVQEMVVISGLQRLRDGIAVNRLEPRDDQLIAAPPSV